MKPVMIDDFQYEVADFLGMSEAMLRVALKEHGTHFGFSIEPKGRVAYFPSNFKGDCDDLTDRVLMKTGKFLRLIIPSCSNDAIIEFSDWLKKREMEWEITITSNVGNVYEMDHPRDDSELGNSCMRHERYNYFLNGVCKCAYIVDDDDNLICRALLWQLPNGEEYLDRIYAQNDAVKEYMMQWGLDNGFLMYRDARDSNLFGNMDLWDVSVPVRNNIDDDVPYMDTFKTLFKAEGKYWLTPQCVSYEKYGKYGYLESTGGDYDDRGKVGMYECDTCDELYDIDSEKYINVISGCRMNICPDCIEDEVMESYCEPGRFFHVRFQSFQKIYTPNGRLGFKNEDLRGKKIVHCKSCSSMNYERLDCGFCSNSLVELEKAEDCEAWEFVPTYQKIGVRNFSLNQRRN